MTVSLSALQIQALVLDIEGTTTPIEFVYTTLFPYARAHVGAFLQRNGESSATRQAVEQLRAEQAGDRARGPRPPESIVDYFGWLMDQDRKSPGLKALQGLIFQEGFVSGELRGDVYPDVPPAFARWRAQGLDVYIYSSGSVLAQKLLFGSTPAGDLATYLKGYFDTGAGPKTEVGSYRTIADAIRVQSSSILFVSDVVLELDAAKAAGMRTVLCVRDRNADLPTTPGHPPVATFDEITE